jgi:ubiquitin C-terminal hydrolase
VKNKIMTEVTYPCVLKLPALKRAASEVDVTGGIKEELSGRIVYKTYVLYSVIIHSGTSAQRGHYYSISRHSDEEALASLMPAMEKNERGGTDESSRIRHGRSGTGA